MDFRRGRQEEPLEINLVPLIDVMMVILIFLMLTGSFAGTEHYLVSNLPLSEKGAGGYFAATSLVDRLLIIPDSVSTAMRSGTNARSGSRPGMAAP